MTEFFQLLVHPQLIGLTAFVVLAMAIVWWTWISLAKNQIQPRIKLLRAVGLCCFGLLIVWLMQQQHHVLSGEVLATSENPVAISLRGVTRFVSHRQALLYEYGMIPILLFGFCYAAIERFVGRYARP